MPVAGIRFSAVPCSELQRSRDGLVSDTHFADMKHPGVLGFWFCFKVSFRQTASEKLTVSMGCLPGTDKFCFYLPFKSLDLANGQYRLLCFFGWCTACLLFC